MQPVELRTCADRPPVPRTEATQADVARYLVDLAGAHHDCKTRLGALNAYLDEVREGVEYGE